MYTQDFMVALAYDHQNSLVPVSRIRTITLKSNRKIGYVSAQNRR